MAGERLTHTQSLLMWIYVFYGEEKIGYQGERGVIGMGGHLAHLNPL